MTTGFLKIELKIWIIQPKELAIRSFSQKWNAHIPGWIICWLD